MTGFRYYLSQFYGLLIKTFLIHCRRWVLTLIILLIPIFYGLSSILTPSNLNENKKFSINIDSFSPQTILYNTDSSIEKYLHASVHNAKFEKRSGDLSQMDEEIWRKNFSLINIDKRIDLFRKNASIDRTPILIFILL